MPPSNHDKKPGEEKSSRYIRPINELWEMWKPRVKMGIYPFIYASYDDMEKVMTSLTSYDHDKWAAAFSSTAKPYEEKAVQAEKNGNAQTAEENYLRAYQHYRLARYPTINSDGKKEAYKKSQEMLLKAYKYSNIPIECVEIPFEGRKGECNKIITYLRLPKTGSALTPCF